VNANVPGLSSKCLKVTTEGKVSRNSQVQCVTRCLTAISAVGPGAKKDGAYKNPEYFCYNENSYFEAEVEMAKYRIPQPSNKKK
jgi:NADH dehydrogenase [ubiquinone] flavoprotein 3, mitochondrial